MLKRLLIILLSIGVFAQDEFVETGTTSYPFFVEILDAEIHPDNSDIVYVVGVGGFFFMDVADMSNPTMIGRYDPGDIFERYYNGDVRGNLAIGAARELGLDFIDASNMAEPTLITRYQRNERTYQGIAIRDNLAYAAIRKEGLEIIDISLPEMPQYIATVPEPENAWDVFLDDELLYVADGIGGLKIFDLSQPTNPQLLSGILGSGAAREVVVEGHLAFVATGFTGVDIFDVSNPSQPVFLSNYQPRFGTLNRVAVDGNTLFVSTWIHIEAVDISDPLNPYLKSTEDTRHRAMGVAADNGRVFATDWWIFRAYHYQNFIEPDIHISPQEFDFGFEGVGFPITRTIDVFNLGEADLVVENVIPTNSRWSVMDTSFTVPPGGRYPIEVTFTPSGIGTAFGNLRYISNDSDEPDRRSELFGGENRLSPGDEAIPFTLNDLEDNPVMLEQFRGRVVLLIFFATW